MVSVPLPPPPVLYVAVSVQLLLTSELLMDRLPVALVVVPL